jgi:putative DNA primase/helicase
MRPHHASHDLWVAKARAVKIEDEIARRAIELGRQGIELVGPCPKCGGDDRFAVNIKKKVFNCRGCKKGGDVIQLVQHLDGVDFKTACTTLTGEMPPKPNAPGGGKGRVAAQKAAQQIVADAFDYQDAGGDVVFTIERIEYRNADGMPVLKDDGKKKKTFRARRSDPSKPGAFIYNLESIERLPYRLPRLIAGVANGNPVLIPEGEAKVDELTELGVVATCNAFGGAVENPAELAAHLRDADVVLLPDNDDVGFKHINNIGALLTGVAKRIRVLLLPNLPLKGDIVDWLANGGTREQLDELVSRAPDWKPPSEKLDDLEKELEKEKKIGAAKSEDELLDALAKMPKGVARGRERKRLAKALGVSKSDLDAEIQARRTEAETKALLHGWWYVEPCPESVDGDALIRDIIRKLRQHVVISFESALAIALWIVAAWVHDRVAIHSPILDITSAEPESGKSTTLAVVSFLVPRAICTVDISRGALYRAIQTWKPSFVIDEFDDVLAARGDSDKSELRSVINSGHTRGQGVLRRVTDEHKPELFSTFAPKAIGMVGRKIPATTASRCITVELRRCKKGEQDQKFEHADDSELANLRRRLRRWSEDNTEALRTVKPSMPDGFENRRADNWRLQFAIADLCSGVEDWGDKARTTAVTIEGSSDSRTVTALLLAAIKIIFDGTEDDAIGSENLCEKLAADPDSEWAEWGKSRKPITQNQLARMLKTHGIRPDQVRPKTLGGRQVRGYHRSWFEDAWARYL